MTRMVVIYRTPADPEAFDRHYFGVHIPLATQLPGLLNYEVSQGPVVPMASADETYRVAILTFASMQAMRSAFATEIGQACAADRRVLAPDPLVQMFLFDDGPVFTGASASS